MDIEYVDILTGENLSSIWVANMDLIFGQFIFLVEFDENIVILAIWDLQST